MRIALYQGPAPTLRDPVAEIADAARNAAAHGAQLLVTPEMSATGYNIGARIEALAEAPGGPLSGRLADAARDARIAIAYGLPVRDGTAVFNTVRVVGADGAELAAYRKTHLYGELDHAHFTPGDDLTVQFTLDGMRIGLLTCYDVEFPETVRAQALAGVDVVVAPTGLMAPYADVATTLVRARALENQVYVVYVNRCGEESGLKYCGSSCAVGPDGRDLVRAGEGEELVYADVDRHALADSRARNPYLADRRPDLYAPLTNAARVRG